MSDTTKAEKIVAELRELHAKATAADTECATMDHKTATEADWERVGEPLNEWQCALHNNFPLLAALADEALAARKWEDASESQYWEALKAARAKVNSLLQEVK